MTRKAAAGSRADVCTLDHDHAAAVRAWQEAAARASRRLACEGRELTAEDRRVLVAESHRAVLQVERELEAVRRVSAERNRAADVRSRRPAGLQLAMDLVEASRTRAALKLSTPDEIDPQPDAYGNVRPVRAGSPERLEELRRTVEETEEYARYAREQQREIDEIARREAAE